jgi:hypothetical protein
MYYHPIENHPAIVFMIKTFNSKPGFYLNYDQLDTVENLIKDNMPDNSYQCATVMSHFVNFVTRIVKHYDLKKELGLVEEYYDMCFLNKNVTRPYRRPQFLDTILYLNEFEEGKVLLKKYGIDLEKGSEKIRQAAFEKYSSGNLLNIQKMQEFVPKEIDHKTLLDKKLSVSMCEFLNHNGIEIPKLQLCILAKQLFNHVSNEKYNTSVLHTGSIERYTNLLIQNASFYNYVAPQKDIHLAIYNYFDKEFPIPKEYNFTKEELLKEETHKINFMNEFSKKLYSNPGYCFMNLNKKIAHKVNLKFSGTKFVHPEVEAENLKKEDETRVVYKKLKI